MNCREAQRVGNLVELLVRIQVGHAQVEVQALALIELAMLMASPRCRWLNVSVDIPDFYNRDTICD